VRHGYQRRQVDAPHCRDRSDQDHGSGQAAGSCCGSMSSRRGGRRISGSD
jgi:hypothetical protein